MNAPVTGDVRIEVDGPVGRLRLNRPGQLHALDLPMCAAMLAALDGWRTDRPLRR